mmetsp:Transcript_8636/g.12743  ORF Transcript_8636/g.12743 Transcript_8636/m.12743 type:complete len:259 (+) Transcript_8636:55-831(+)
MRLLPLHLAVMSGKHWTDGVASLYAAHPRAASISEPLHHWLPLHCAAAATKMTTITTNNNLASVVKALVHHRPECATVVDCHGRLPLHLMGLTANWAKLADKEGSAVLDVIRAYPEAVDARDDAGAVPNVMQKFKNHQHCHWNKDHDDEMSNSSIQKNTNSTATALMASCSQEAYSVMSMMSSSAAHELELNCSTTYVNINADNESNNKDQDSSANEEENGGNIFHSWMIQMVRGGGDEVLQAPTNSATEFELATMTS